MFHRTHPILFLKHPALWEELSWTKVSTAGRINLDRLLSGEYAAAQGKWEGPARPVVFAGGKQDPPPATRWPVYCDACFIAAGWSRTQAPVRCLYFARLHKVGEGDTNSNLGHRQSSGVFSHCMYFYFEKGDCNSARLLTMWFQRERFVIYRWTRDLGFSCKCSKTTTWTNH